ncbi:hypothetical protein [Gemmobacter sp. 24YEA27]|uniref:hypothetical protein n=1 Tax=Gemmobacter sp. 24YEA27 TaxID=3040672 RepID=UPI0024B3BFB8|nr:hypothetical protein [Gemmobacter sp. 24YEA27]
MERDLDHIAIGILGRHFHPVTNLDHVGGADLNRCDQRQQRILKDEDENGGQRPKSGEKDQGRAVDDRRNHQDRRNAIDENCRNLNIALDGSAIARRTPVPDGVEQPERRRDGHRKNQDVECVRDVSDDCGDGKGQTRYLHDAGRNHQGRRGIGDPCNHPGPYNLGSLDILDPFDQAVKEFHQHRLGNDVHQECGKDQRTEPE